MNRSIQSSQGMDVWIAQNGGPNVGWRQSGGQTSPPLYATQAMPNRLEVIGKAQRHSHKHNYAFGVGNGWVVAPPVPLPFATEAQRILATRVAVDPKSRARKLRGGEGDAREVNAGCGKWQVPLSHLRRSLAGVTNPHRPNGRLGAQGRCRARLPAREGTRECSRGLKPSKG